MRTITGKFDGSEGTIRFHRWDPDTDDVTGVVVIVHGYAEHGARYAHVAAALAGDGVSTWASDHIGHGRSDGERALIADFEHVVDDLETLVGLVDSAFPGRPVVMVGHSMGGLLTARFVQRDPDRLAGAAFLGAVLGDWPWAREVLAEAELPVVDSDPYGMSRDRAACDAYAADPLVYHGTYKRPLLEAEVACLDRMRAELDRIGIPLLFLHGDADPFVPHEPSLAALQATPAAAAGELTIQVYEGAKHELVNETNRDEVIAELRAFVARVNSSH